jgi:hypothetical protein
VLLVTGFLISACSEGDSASAAIENYLQALADKDQVSAVGFSCVNWEEQAAAEGASFVNVQVELQDLACQVEQENGSTALVSCQGKYIFSYDAGEDQTLDLSGRLFRAVQENGTWRMCGYQD